MKYYSEETVRIIASDAEKIAFSRQCGVKTKALEISEYPSIETPLNPWKAGHPSECMWVLVRLENGEYGFDYWEGHRWKNHDPERFVTPRIVAWSDYVDPCKDAH